jgi:6-phosphofructokinase 1
MGRACGYLAVVSGVIGGAEMVLIPEVETSLEEISSTIENAYERGKTHAIIIVAEGFPIQITDLARQLGEMELGFSTKVTILGHIQRGGKPSAYDRWLASRMGVRAVEFMLDGQSGLMTGLNGLEIEGVPLADVTSHKKTISREYVDMCRTLAR